MENNKDKTKLKSIIIDGSLHQKLKLHCKGSGIKIGSIVEDLIRLYLHSPKRVHEEIEFMKENSSTKLHHDI